MWEMHILEGLRASELGNEKGRILSDTALISTDGKKRWGVC